CLLFGALSDKEVGGMLRAWRGLVRRLVVTRPENPRALDPAVIEAEKFLPGVPVERIHRVTRAFERALEARANGELVCVTGSCYTVGEVLGAIRSLRGREGLDIARSAW
ncbi:MAG: glutamate ligase domain-containing protein, partial [Vicinamibacteria bacterium]